MVCGGGSTIIRENLYGYRDTRFKMRIDTDFTLSITKRGYKVLYVKVGMSHLHEMTVKESLITYAFKRGYYGALLELKHRDYFGNPYTNRINILYFGVILDLPLCVLFLAGIVPWWLGIWSILGIGLSIIWSLVKKRGGITFSIYHTTRELVTHLGLMTGLIRFDAWEKIKSMLRSPRAVEN